MRDIIFIAVECGLLALVVWQLLLAYRAEYVMDYILRTFKHDPELFARLPSFNTMRRQLFRWDWSDYLEGKR